MRDDTITMSIKIDLQGNVLQVKNADAMQFTVIKSWNKMKWDRKLQALIGIADIELLDKLASLVQLPPEAEKRRRELHIVRDAVDRERVNQNPKAFCKFPVKLPLYAHQVRAANMALLTFGWADAKERG